jgi:hypothetical protein
MKLNISKIFNRIVLGVLASSMIFSISLPTLADTNESIINENKEEIEDVVEDKVYANDETEITVTGDLEEFLLSEDTMNNSINMTDKQVLDLYEQYTKDKNINKEDFSVENLKSFADYAVDNGIIDDTDIARVDITKSFVRSQFRIFAGMGNAVGLKTASQLLRHSLQDNPRKLRFSSGSGVSGRVRRSSECRDIINNAKSSIRGNGQTTYNDSGSTTLNSTRDLHLAFNRVDYEVNGRVLTQRGKRKKWELEVKFTDTYDFDIQGWNNEMSPNSKAITILNNYAAIAQSLGAIVPYDVVVSVKIRFFSS